MPTHFTDYGLVSANLAEGIKGVSMQVTASTNLTTIAANAAASTTFNVPGARIGDVVLVSPHVNPNNAATWCGAVLSNGVVTVRVANNSGSAIDPAATRFSLLVFHGAADFK